MYSSWSGGCWRTEMYRLQNKKNVSTFWDNMITILGRPNGLPSWEVLVTANALPCWWPCVLFFFFGGGSADVAKGWSHVGSFCLNLALKLSKWVARWNCYGGFQHFECLVGGHRVTHNRHVPCPKSHFQRLVREWQDLLHPSNAVGFSSTEPTWNGSCTCCPRCLRLEWSIASPRQEL